MKTNILTRSVTALLLTLPLAQAADPLPEAPKPKPETITSSSSVITSADGTATVTIDINGKKETRTFKLGGGERMFTFGKDGDGVKVSGVAGIGPTGTLTLTDPAKAKREKGPWIGIAMEPVQEVVRAQLSLAPGEGIVVSHIMPESPAAKAGLQVNDILLRFEDQILVEPSQLKKLIGMKKPGESVKLTYLRKGERKEAAVTLVEHEFETYENDPAQGLRIPPIAPAFPGAGAGNRLEHFQEQLREMKEKHPGVIVEKRSWLGGTPGDAIAGQIERLQRSLDESKLPKEEIEKLRKELERAKRETQEATERAKRTANEAMEQARRAMEEAKARGESRKPQKPETGEEPKKPGESL